MSLTARRAITSTTDAPVPDTQASETTSVAPDSIRALVTAPSPRTLRRALADPPVDTPVDADGSPVDPAGSQPDAVRPPRVGGASRVVLRSRLDTRPSRMSRAFSLGGLFIVLGLIAWHVCMKVLGLSLDDPTAIYTIVVTSYVLSRFVLAAIYRPPAEVDFLPPVAIVVPAFNEGEAVVRTIDSCLALDYPRELMEVVVIDDGSSDDTYAQMCRAAERYPAGTVTCLTLGTNQGKRAAMAAGIRATSAEVLVFVDSDSMPGADSVRLLVQGLAHDKVGAVAGLTYARNADENLLTRMQASRYYVSYQLLKAAESALGAVACCSGCFAAYRRAAVLEVLDEWEHQTWFGMECTYGDDRSLTNMLLRRGWRTIYDNRAEAWTDVPSKYRKFFKQQLRWKKSWLREGPLLLGHLWRTRTRAFVPVLLATVAGLLSPVVLLYNLRGIVMWNAPFPVVYCLGLYLIAVAYSLVYRLLRNDGLWISAFIGTIFYIAFSPQLLWALVRIRDGRWGTRDPGAAAQPALTPVTEGDAR